MAEGGRDQKEKHGGEEKWPCNCPPNLPQNLPMGAILSKKSGRCFDCASAHSDVKVTKALHTFVTMSIARVANDLSVNGSGYRRGCRLARRALRAAGRGAEGESSYPQSGGCPQIPRDAPGAPTHGGRGIHSHCRFWLPASATPASRNTARLRPADLASYRA